MNAFDCDIISIITLAIQENSQKQHKTESKPEIYLQFNLSQIYQV